MRSVNKISLLGIAVLTAGVALAEHPKMARGLETISPTENVDVIVQYKHTPGFAQHQKLGRVGGTHKGDLHLISGDVVSMPASSLATLADDPDVAFIAPDRPVKGMLDLTVAAVNGNVAAQLGWTGTGIGVAVIDSGIDNHPDLLKSIVYSASFVTGPRSDHYGHGTHVAGIIGGSGASSHGKSFTRTFVGIAPDVNLIDLQALDQDGSGTDSSVIAAIQQAIQLKSKYNIRVINLSLGRPVFESYTVDPLCQAVEAAWKAGIVVVVAAGNNGRDNSAGTNGYGTITAPGNDPYVITVGAMKTMGTPSRNDDLIASYSSKGPTLFDHIVKPDIVAPGNRVASLLSSKSKLDTEYPRNDVHNSYYEVNGNSDSSHTYYTLSGTSMATPVVSGAAALLIQQHPSLTPDQVKARLMKTAYKSFPASSVTVDPTTHVTYTSQYDVFTVGAGYLDIAAALNNSDLLSVTAISPAVTYDAAKKSYSLVFPNAITWGSAIIWGTNIIWGTSVLQGNANIVDGSAIIWGTHAVPGLALIWGSNILWDTSNLATAEDGGVLIVGEP